MLNFSVESFFECVAKGIRRGGDLGHASVFLFRERLDCRE